MPAGLRPPLSVENRAKISIGVIALATGSKLVDALFGDVVSRGVDEFLSRYAPVFQDLFDSSNRFWTGALVVSLIWGACEFAYWHRRRSVVAPTVIPTVESWLMPEDALKLLSGEYAQDDLARAEATLRTTKTRYEKAERAAFKAKVTNIDKLNAIAAANNQAQQARDAAYIRLVKSLTAKLERGELVGKGIKSAPGQKADEYESLIPPEQWRIAELIAHVESVRAGGYNWLGLRIGRPNLPASKRKRLAR